MTEEQKTKYLEDRETARYFYANTRMNVAQIARFLRISETKCHAMIDHRMHHREPKWFREGDWGKK